jgi:hypothetical protein
VQVGDIIVDIDGDAARSATAILDAIDDRRQGETVAIIALRGGKQQQLSLTLEDDPGVRMHGFDFPTWFGDDDDLREQFDELERRLEQLERGRPQRAPSSKSGMRT